MADWLRQKRFDSPYLHWYVNYACRDDYGALAADTSAWAGIHYFASRETGGEGSAHLARRQRLDRAPAARKAGALRPAPARTVHRIAREGRKLRVLPETPSTSPTSSSSPRRRFLRRTFSKDAPPVHGFDYSPWLTANLTLDRLPRERGIETAWDNVIYDSPALGYVVATHQILRTHVDRTVWTFYWALAEGSPAENRRLLLEKDWGYWKEAILNDLARAHPDIRAVRLAHRHHADGPRHGAADAGISGIGRAPAADHQPPAISGSPIPT